MDQSLAPKRRDIFFLSVLIIDLLNMILFVIVLILLN